MTDKIKEIETCEKLLKDNPQWGVMRKWSLQVYINQLKGVEIPPHPLEGQPIRETPQPVQTQPSSTQPLPDTGIPTPPNKSTTSKPKLDKAINHIDELKKRQAEGKLKPSEIKKQKLAQKETKKTLKEWLEEGSISDEKYDFLNEWLKQDEVFSLAEINAKY
jgi:hypothetical protein